MKKKIAIIGMGYVGLPLAIEFSKKNHVIGFDLDIKKVRDIKKKYNFYITKNLNEIKKCNYYVVAVPTPITKSKTPDLENLKIACENLGKVVKDDDIIIFESTVYPGCTEHFCIPIIEKISKLKLNEDFYCGYSPERINPGDKKHTLRKINKIVSASNSNTLKKIFYLYKSIIDKKIYKAESIKIAEAAKIIENTQRDLNIALINEFSKILHKLKLDTKKVINAASTKWNFHKYYPGLVGGHCVGVDPYYLTHIAKKNNINSKIILAGRKTNDGMGTYVFHQVKNKMKKKKIEIHKSNVLIMGFTFKENCEDVRNTKVLDIINQFKKEKSNVEIFDPIVDIKLVKKLFGLKIIKKLKKINFYDVIIITVAHDEIKKIKFKNILKLAKKNKVIFDVKNIFKNKNIDGRL